MVCGIWKFNAAFTRAFQESLSWAKSILFPVLIPISLRSIILLSSHLRLEVLSVSYKWVAILKAMWFYRRFIEFFPLHIMVHLDVKSTFKYYKINWKKTLVHNKQWHNNYIVYINIVLNDKSLLWYFLLYLCRIYFMISM